MSEDGARAFFRSLPSARKLMSIKCWASVLSLICLLCLIPASVDARGRGA